MPRKSGKRTGRERVFVEHMAASGDAVYSATQAGYAHPPSAAVQLSQRPAIAAAIKRKELDRVTNDLLPLATDRVEKILKDPKENSRVVLAAAKLVWDRSFGGQDGDGSKEPHEMTADELQNRIAQLRDIQTALANGAKDITPPEAGQDAPESGAFG
ncbi:hypothetical protein PhaeoP66_03218 [Phaeobacter inhibens]|uniref:Terminase small subunit n=1 Tax=Phaeobacter inhibens TaxID=221822 RepID=A0ABM6RHI4_9RHOB|nr:hypothetical protein [Phaeobacter inhibens]AUQ95960.1 hypothetical protein PhaeoP66_03218 [Phaeobacter inhibens]